MGTRRRVIAFCGVDGRFFGSRLLPLRRIGFRGLIRPWQSSVTAFGNVYLGKLWIHGMTSITLGAAYIFLAHRTNFLA